MLLRRHLSQQEICNHLSPRPTIPTTQHTQHRAIGKDSPPSSSSLLRPLLRFAQLLCNLETIRDHSTHRMHILYLNPQVVARVRVTFHNDRWHLKHRTSMVLLQELLQASPLVSLPDLIINPRSMQVADLDLPFPTATSLRPSMFKAPPSMMLCSILACELHI